MELATSAVTLPLVAPSTALESGRVGLTAIATTAALTKALGQDAVSSELAANIALILMGFPIRLVLES